MPIQINDRVYYDHGDNDNTDTGTVLDIVDRPEEQNGIERMAETVAFVLFDNPSPSGEFLAETAVANLRLV